MNNPGRFVFLTLCLVFGVSIAQINAQTPKQNFTNRSASNPKDVILKLRDLYEKRDYDAGYELGKPAAAQYSDNVELQAWFLLNTARSEMSQEAIPQAKALTEKYKDNGWAWFALSNAYHRKNLSKQGVDAGAKAFALDKRNAEFIINHAYGLRTLGKYDESYALIAANATSIKDKSRIAYINGETRYNQSILSPKETNEAQRKQSFEDFAQAVKLNPKSLNANYVYGSYLSCDKRFDEALPFLRKAAMLSPGSTQIRQELWKSIQGQANKTDDQKKAELIADLDLWLNANPKSPKVIKAVSEQYGILKNTEKRDFYENQITKEYPDSRYAETIEYDRINRAVTDSAKNIDSNKIMEAISKMADAKTPEERAKLTAVLGDPKEQAEMMNRFKQMRWAFVKRPVRYDEKKFGETYYNLLTQSNLDKNITDEELSELIEGSLKYKKDNYTNVNVGIARILISGKTFRPNSRFNNEVDNYIKAALIESEDKIKALPSNYDSSMKIIIEGDTLNTIGTVLRGQNKLDEAEAMLLRVQKMLPENSEGNFRLAALTRSNNQNLASLYEAKKDYDKAEMYYLSNAEGRPTDTYFFKTLHRKRNDGTSEADYLKAINEKISLKLKTRLINSRIKNPKDAAPFTLKTIDGKTVSFADLKGKVIVINFWGTWCAPCVAEMPEFQQLHKKYENDKDVAIITMDSNDELEAVQKFMADKKYDFPVLIGDSYTSNILINGTIGFPTTLFISKQGKIEFIKTSNSAKLFEEFGWRIEALKADN